MGRLRALKMAADSDCEECGPILYTERSGCVKRSPPTTGKASDIN